MNTHAAAPGTSIGTRAQASQQSTTTWEHIRYALDENRALGEKTWWLLSVDLERTRTKFRGQGTLDEIFHLAFCWEWWAVAHFRVSHWAHKRLLPDLGRSRLLQRLLFLQQAALLRFCYASGRIVSGLSGCRLEPWAEIGPGFLIMHSGSCGVGRGSQIGSNFTLFQDANVVARHGNDYPVIGDNVTVYSGARLVGPVHVGSGTRVGANAVVLHDLPEGCLALGVPARPVSTGESIGGPAPSAFLNDLLCTWLETGDLEAAGPGRYFDKQTGITFTAYFDGDEGDRASANGSYPK